MCGRVSSGPSRAGRNPLVRHPAVTTGPGDAAGAIRAPPRLTGPTPDRVMPKASDNPSLSLFDAPPASAPPPAKTPQDPTPAPPAKGPQTAAPAVGAPPAAAQVERDVYTVTRLNREVRMLLEHRIPLVWLEGELSNFSAPASGHWY